MIFIIEHLDEELWDWSLLEYTHISSFVGKENLWFTNIKSKKEQKKLEKLGVVFTESVTKMKLKNVCVLDPLAKKELQPTDTFEHIIIGGLLGHEELTGRTEKELAKPMGTARNLGQKQMSTNTAAYVAWKVTHGTPLNTLQYSDDIVIPVEEGLEVTLPYRFVVENGKLVLPKGYIEMAKKSF